MVRSFVLLIVVASLVGTPAILVAQSRPSVRQDAPGGPDLKTTLEKGLKARRPVEFQFIALVVQRVKSGSLPIALVNSTFLWAKRQQPYPFPYFERGLRERAKKSGIAI